ncbi:hypothetical protein Y032_0123g1116 [Ancylostoma ceylanicum]|uniref:7TM GPCR serpentine receptor class x (Srx) domain-containing protein n=1 Tax=Ancylostoma ceylanicum TaxID=53326 RepID=A0A016T9B8_9BILA|nr:hypothetical protein Y032_0123g1116 [Ancylostoma ceylanicum]
MKLSLLGRNCSVKQKNIHRRNIQLFLQGCLTACSFTIMLCCSHFICLAMKTKWAVFATTTLIWEVSHAVDGVIILVLNDSFQAALTEKVTKVESNTVVTLTRT